MKVGRFLGFMLTEREIDVSLNKFSAILNPGLVKEVQQLTGRITTIYKFLPIATNKGFPHFQCLNTKAKFIWLEECEQAF